jgi:hypothetical protein
MEVGQTIEFVAERLEQVFNLLVLSGKLFLCFGSFKLLQILDMVPAIAVVAKRCELRMYSLGYW